MFPRERLNRLLSVLTRQGGAETVRQLTRRFAIFPSEIAQAEALRWVEIETRKSRTGRPSRIVRLSKNPAAKLPPWRWQIARPISFRHWRFARRSVFDAVRGGMPGHGIPPLVAAYRDTYPQAKSEAGAAASCSRLIRHPDVFAARQYCFARLAGEIPRVDYFPRTAAEIWEILKYQGSWRAEYSPAFPKLF